MQQNEQLRCGYVEHLDKMTKASDKIKKIMKDCDKTVSGAPIIDVTSKGGGQTLQAPWSAEVEETDMLGAGAPPEYSERCFSCIEMSNMFRMLSSSVGDLTLIVRSLKTDVGTLIVKVEDLRSKIKGSPQTPIGYTEPKQHLMQTSTTAIRRCNNPGDI